MAYIYPKLWSTLSKLSNNILLLISVIIGVLINFIVISFYGVSSQMDMNVIIYLIINIIILFLSFLSEQFVYYYNHLYAKNKQDAFVFFSTLLFTYTVVAVVLCLAAPLLSNLTVLHLLHINNSQYGVACSVLTFGIMFAVLTVFSGILNGLLLSYTKITHMYIIQIIAGLTNIGYIIFNFYVMRNNSIEYLTYSNVISASLAVILSIVVILLKTDVLITLKLNKKFLIDYCTKGFKIRMSHNINNIVVPYMCTYFLSMSASGNPSQYNYGKKLSDIVNQIVLGPTFLKYRTEISVFWPNGQMVEIKRAIESFHKKIIVVFLPFALLSVICSYFILPLIFGNLSLDSIKIICIIFGIFLAWYTILFFEAPYVQVLTVQHKYRPFLAINSINAMLIFLLIKISWNFFGIFSIPAAIFVAQIFNFIIYKKMAQNDLNRGNNEQSTY